MTLCFSVSFSIKEKKEMKKILVDERCKFVRYCRQPRLDLLPSSDTLLFPVASFRNKKKRKRWNLDIFQCSTYSQFSLLIMSGNLK
jgi:hypothetical protein